MPCKSRCLFSAFLDRVEADLPSRGANSVDKNADGDYLLSATGMNAIYRISGLDGSIMWQLGGTSSSFRLQGFNFSRQHDARFVAPSSLPSSPADSLEYVSFVDNAVDHGADDQEHASSTSSAMLVALDLAGMVAIAKRRVMRPDGAATPFGGNAHFLPNGNWWVAWAGDGYATEFDANGRPVMETRFRSDRFTTYRAYKGDFKAVPLESLALKCLAYGTSSTTAITVCFVSWNGATDVQRWRFYSGPPGSQTNVVGVAERDGFETRIQLRAYLRTVTVEGIGSRGEVLGASEEVEVTSVGDWGQDDIDRQGGVVRRLEGIDEAHSEL